MAGLDDVGVRMEEVSPRQEAAALLRQRFAGRVFVRAASELRALAGVWAACGLAAVVAAAVFGELARLTGIEVVAVLLLLFIVPAASVGAMVLGTRTPPLILYRLLLDRAPAPPETIARESRARTVVRAGIAALALALAFLPVAALALAFAEVIMGRTREEIPSHLPEEATLVAGGWMLVASTAAFQIRRWIARWETVRNRRALCPPLSSGLLSPVYFSEPAPGHADRPWEGRRERGVRS